MTDKKKGPTIGPPSDAVAAAIERIQLKDEPVKVKVKAHGRNANRERKSRGESTIYSDYAPSKFAKHPLARGVNFALDKSSPPTEKADGAGALEVGEAWVAAGYYGLGLPPYEPSKGEGHPYFVAVERTGRWAFPKVARSPTFATLRALVQQRLRGAKA